MSNESFELYPALDIKDGVIARSPKSSLSTISEVLASYERPGISWLHLVDLDFTFQRGSNETVIRNIISDTSLKIQLSGGIRDLEAFKYGSTFQPDRINLAPDFLLRRDEAATLFEESKSEISFAIDVDENYVVSRATGQVLGDLAEVICWLNDNGCPRIILTESKNDGRLQGVNLDLYTRMRDLTSMPIIASGGVSKVDDVVNLASIGISGAVIGAALHHGSLDLTDAIVALGAM